jgi:hypothetical protein
MKNIMLYILSRVNIKQYKPPLGRWNIESCNKKLNNKIDLANEDHCGTCGKYLKNILNKNIKKINQH